MNKTSFNFEDVMQVIVGASALAVPIAFSEESWRLSETLPTKNIALLVILSLLFVNLYSFQGVFQGNVSTRIVQYLGRTFFVYSITLLIVALILYSLNRLPIEESLTTALKRIIILAFPASMGAIVVDSFDKE